MTDSPAMPGQDLRLDVGWGELAAVASDKSKSSTCRLPTATVRARAREIRLTPAPRLIDVTPKMRSSPPTPVKTI